MIASHIQHTSLCSLNDGLVRDKMGHHVRKGASAFITPFVKPTPHNVPALKDLAQHQLIRQHGYRYQADTLIPSNQSLNPHHDLQKDDNIPTLFIFKVSFHIRHLFLFETKNTYVMAGKRSYIQEESNSYSLPTGTPFGSMPLVVTQAIEKNSCLFFDTATITIFAPLPPKVKQLRRVLQTCLRRGLIKHELIDHLALPTKAKFTIESSFYFARDPVPGITTTYVLTPNLFSEARLSDIKDIKNNVKKILRKNSSGHYLQNMRQRAQTVVKELYEADGDLRIFPYDKLFLYFTCVSSCKCQFCSFFRKNIVGK